MTGERKRRGARYLVLSVDIGAGHRQAGEALCRALIARRPGGRYDVIEALDHLGPAAGKMARDFYFGVLEEAPGLWGMLYEGRELISLFRPLSELVDSLRIGALEPLVKAYAPDVILAMHPIACGLAAALGRGQKTDCPRVAVLTDFDGHPAWIANGLDLYLAATPRVVSQLERRDLPSGKAVATGIPLRQAFARIRQDVDAGDRLGLARGRFTILLLGGGLGLGPIGQAAEALSTLDGPVQLVLIAGKNAELEGAARGVAERAAVPFHVRGTVDDIWDYMSAADLAVGKPGGLTSAELLAAGVPLVALAPIPGQEMANCNSLVEMGAAIHAPTPAAAKTAVLQLLGSLPRREEMREAALRNGRPDAADAAAREVLALIDAGPDRRRARRDPSSDSPLSSLAALTRKLGF